MYLNIECNCKMHSSSVLPVSGQLDWKPELLHSQAMCPEENYHRMQAAYQYPLSAEQTFCYGDPSFLHPSADKQPKHPNKLGLHILTALAA